MNKHLISAVALLSACAINAADVVLPEGMIALTPDGVELTSENADNKTQNKKPIVKTDNNLLFFTAKTAEHGDELWVSGLTPETTRMVKDINAGSEGSNPSYLTAVGNRVFFVAETPESGTEVWVSDGTEAGTYMVKEIYPGAGGCGAFGLSKFQDKVMFFAMDEESEFVPTVGIEPEKWLWITDGTEEGTVRLGNTPTRQDNYDGDAGVIVEANGLAFFVSYNLEMNETLYVSDGTPGGTKPVKNINPKAQTGNYKTASAAIDWLTPVNDKWVVFRAETVSEVTGTTDMGSEIWVSDGTEAGTNWIGFDFAKGETDGLPTGTQFAIGRAYGDILYFRADDGVHGVEPCIFDLSQPIEEGVNPRMLVDINHWGGSANLHSWPSGFHLYDGKLFMQANGGYFLDGDDTEYASGYSLWRVDTETYTNLEYSKQWCGFEIYKGNQRDNSCWFENVGSKMFFVAQDQDSNMELWCMDNADAQPEKIVDLPENGDLHSLMNIGENLYFASMGTKALYRYMVEGSDPGSVEGVNVTDVKVYPTVSDAVINIESEHAVMSVALYDMQGAQVMKAGEMNQISVAEYQPGLYVLVVTLDNGETVSQKIIVE